MIPVRTFIEEAERSIREAEKKESTGNYIEAQTLYKKAAKLYIAILEEGNGLSQDMKKKFFSELQGLERKIKNLQNKKKEKVGPNSNITDTEEDTSDQSSWLVEKKPNINFSDIAGLNEVKEIIKTKVIYPLKHPEEASMYGVGIGGGVLFFGPPGTGKTMLAKAIANEVDAYFFLVTSDTIINKWVGESEKNIAKLFQKARAYPRSIIFFDEIEPLASKRRSTNSSVVPRVVTQLLNEMDGFATQKSTKDRFLLVIAATNLIDQIDEALLRPGRFAEKIYVGLPDAEAREMLFRLKLKDKFIKEDINYKRLAELTEGYSGADIQFIVTKAGEEVFREVIHTGTKRPITQEDLEKAIKNTPKSVDKELLKKFEKYRQKFATGG